MLNTIKDSQPIIFIALVVLAMFAGAIGVAQAHRGGLQRATISQQFHSFIK